ncbi:MAG: TlpA family protein disulfide reductase [Desulfobacteraceae bacterium]|nr:TlpA family protein disulfide reductase [Desulfobacteraceae bacterium]
MKTEILLALVISLCFCFFCPGDAVSGDQEKPPRAGEAFPAVLLSVPENPASRSYLGLSSEAGTFEIGSIKARLLVIEIFSMYCPYCQKEAPKVNQLYQKIENDSHLKERIKLIGIGAGNSAYEVDVFRKKYNVRFPLIPDPGFEIYGQIGEVRTPFFFVVKISREEKPHRVVHTELGGLNGVSRFLEKTANLLKSADRED